MTEGEGDDKPAGRFFQDFFCCCGIRLDPPPYRLLQMISNEECLNLVDLLFCCLNLLQSSPHWQNLVFGAHIGDEDVIFSFYFAGMLATNSANNTR